MQWSYATKKTYDHLLIAQANRRVCSQGIVWEMVVGSSCTLPMLKRGGFFQYLQDHPGTCKWLVTLVYKPWKGHSEGEQPF